MIGLLWTNTQVNFILELVVACAVLTRPLRKRSHFPVRLCLSMLGSLLLWCGMILLTPLGTWIDPNSGRLVLQSLGYILCFLGTSLPIFLICCRTDPLNAISYAACAYAMQHVAYVAVAHRTPPRDPDRAAGDASCLCAAVSPDPPGHAAP